MAKYLGQCKKSKHLSPLSHAKLSVKKRGGKVDDYYTLHSFIDSTKEICSDNRHRILHTIWGIRRVIIPIFGHELINSDGRKLSVKEICEKDHIIPDYGNKFIPNLSDFSDALIPLSTTSKKAINRIHQEVALSDVEYEILLSPLAVTGNPDALIFTHNTWFIYSILPKLSSRKITFPLNELELIPAKEIFTNMNFQMWMDNGLVLPPSLKRLDL